MDANDLKGDRWRHYTPRQLFIEVIHHARKLARALRAGNAAFVKEFAVDLGVCAMFALHSVVAFHELYTPNASGIYGDYWKDP